MTMWIKPLRPLLLDSNTQATEEVREVEKGRAKELIALGLAEEVDAPKAKAAPAPENKMAPDAEDKAVEAKGKRAHK